jgi:5-methylthioadenosine/S-adenosylhomocysteine deaminase
MNKSHSRSREKDGRSAGSDVSRRELIAAGTVMAAAATALPLSMNTAAAQGSAGGDATLERLKRAAGDGARRILIRGGTILSLDTSVGDFAVGDLLIEGKKIAAVGPDLAGAAQGGNTIVVDAVGMVVVPGLIDCHRHSWEGQIRGIIPDSSSIGDYMAATHRGFAPFYQPEDMYVGNLATALGCIDAGITCIIDNSHNSRSAAHSNAAVKALIDSGIRAVHASGAPTFGDWDKQWPGDLERLQRQYFSSEDQLVTLRIFSRGLVKDDWQLAQRMGLWLSVDGAGAPNNAQTLQGFKRDGLLDERRTFNHGTGLADESWSLIRDAGISVNACPRSDAQWALGTAEMGLQAALNRGIRPGLSVDNDTAYSTDLFAEMHAALNLQRWAVHGAKTRGEAAPARLTVRDMLEFATVRGAQSAALARKIGTLAPGKEADIVLIRATDINTLPLTNAVATVVSYAHAGNVDAVFIAGAPRKWAGKLIDVDLIGFRARVQRSRDALFARRGMKVDVLG